MKKVLAALLVGASMMAAVPASAAVYAVVVHGTGSGTLLTRNSDFSLSETPIYAIDVIYYVDYTPSASSSSFRYYNSGSGTESSIGFGPDTFSLSASRNGMPGAGSVSISGSSCGAFYGYAGVSSDGCANTLSVFYGNTGGSSTGVGGSGTYRFDGAIQYVTAFESTGSATGLDRVTAGVPEPTIWAMMLVGFAATGAALRRRRSAISCQRA